MDHFLLHTAMELSAAACLFFISWLNLTYQASGKYSTIMAIGTAIAGTADLIHAFIVYFVPDLMALWEPWSWSTTRLTLIMTFMAVFFCHDVFNCKTKYIAMLLSVPLITSTITAILYSQGIVTLSWVYEPTQLSEHTIYRPLDFALLIGWIVMAVLLRTKAHVLFPPNMYWLFMWQGIILHTVVAFMSTHSTDMAFCIAHGLKISEYYTFILVYLLYKNELDHRMPKHKYPEQNNKDFNRTGRWHQWKI